MDIIRIFVPEACEQEASPVGCGGPVPIGYVGESGVRQVVLDFSPWTETYGPGALTLMVRRNGDTDAYPVALEIDGSRAAWTVSNVDTHVYGVGRAQYMYVVDGENVKSAIFQTFVDKSVTQPGTNPPDPYDGWVQQLTQLGAETLANAQAAAESAEAALDAKTAAETAQASAASSATSASGSATAAASSATAAAGSASDAATAKTAAEAAQTAAAASAAGASDSADSAASSATAASGSATAAANSATAAAASAAATEEYEHDAEAWAVGKRGGTDVESTDSTYHNNSKYYAAQAAADASTASSAASAASQSEQNAAASATSASQSETNAAASETAAAGSASTATTAATAASNSATAAANSATAAGDAKTAAETAQGKAEDAQEAAEQAQSDAEDAAQSVSQSAAQIETNRQDISDLKSTVNDPATGLNNKANAIINTASGTIASFDDGADGLPLKKLVVNIKPVQAGSGNPSPQNIRPISGWAGCSVMTTNVAMPAYKTFAITPIQQGSGNPSPYNVRPILPAFTLVRDDSTILTVYGGTLKVNSDGTGQLVVDKDSITIDGSAEWLELSPHSSKFFAPVLVKNIAKESFNYISNLYPFAGNGASASSSVTFDKRFYGQRSHGRIWVYDTGYSSVDDFKTALNTTPFQVVYPLDSPLLYNLTAAETSRAFDALGITVKITSYQIPTPPGTVYAGTLTINDDGTGVLKARPYYASYNGETLVGPWVSSKDVCSPGATPTTGAQVVDMGGTETAYNIIGDTLKTILGTNNIWADCGDVTLEYPADTKLYIQEINAPSDDDMTADTQIASGKYFIIGNSLYLSTTTIPAGDAIIPGTNCTKTNLAEALNALNT